MPGKKKGKGKGKKKGSEKKADEAGNAEPEIQMEEKTKQYYMTQITTLRKKVTNLQAQCDKYLVSQQDNMARIESLKEIRLGSRTFLTRQMDEINFEINNYNQQLRELDEAKENERSDLLKQINELRTRDLQETREKNENENHMLRSKLNSLDELKSKKEALLSQIDELDSKLKEQEHEYNEEIYYKEKDAVLEKDRLRKDMGSRVNDLSSEFRRVSKMQVVQTTRQIILENVRLNQKMIGIEDENNQTELKNGKIREGKKTLSLELSLLEERERMMAKKQKKTNQLIEKLTDECSTNERFIQNLEEKVSALEDTRNLIEQLEEMNERAEKQSYQAIEENELLRRTVSQREESLSKLEHENEKTQQIIDNVVEALEQAIEVSNDNTTDKTRSDMDVRFRVFEHIILLLNLATQLGVGPKLNDLAKETSSPIGFFSNNLFEPQHDERSLSPPVRLGALKKVTSKSVGVQTSVSNRNPVPYQMQHRSESLLKNVSVISNKRPSIVST